MRATRFQRTTAAVLALFILLGYLFYPSLLADSPNPQLDLDAIAPEPFIAAGPTAIYGTGPPAKPASEPIAITLVLIGAGIVREGAVAIKSALAHASRPVDLHLICTADAVPALDAYLALVRAPYYAVRVRYYPVAPDALRRRSERAGVGRNYSVLAKLYIQELLHDVERVIYIDTDAIFVVDPVQLWETFDTFNTTTTVAFPTLGPTSHPGQICTCVMLLHLARMRAPHTLWMPSSLLPAYASPASAAFAAARAGGIADPNHPNTRVPFDPLEPFFADQGVYHAFWSYAPAYFAHLSLRWDITHCRGRYGLALGHIGDPDGDDISEERHRELQREDAGAGESLIVPGILHFNCLPDGGDFVWGHNDTYGPHAAWGALVTAAVRYKWVWLNRGDGLATMTRDTVADVRFLDERLANELARTNA